MEGVRVFTRAFLGIVTGVIEQDAKIERKVVIFGRKLIQNKGQYAKALAQTQEQLVDLGFLPPNMI